MSIKSNLTKALGLGVVVAALSAGAAFAEVATASANVRSGPGLGFHPVDRLHAGEFVRVTDQDGRWCEISHRGPDGWVSCGLLASGSIHRYDRYDGGRYSRFHDDYWDRDVGPSVQFRFGTNGSGVRFNSGFGY
jgi:uncharacterized protein YraI